MNNKDLNYFLQLPYKVEVFQDNDPDNPGWVACVPDLPGCITQGDTFRELEEMIEDAKRAWLETALERDIPIPESRQEEEYSGKFVMRVPKSLHRRLVEEAEREGVSLNAYCNTCLAEAIGQTQLVDSVSEKLIELARSKTVFEKWQFAAGNEEIGAETLEESGAGRLAAETVEAREAYQVNVLTEETGEFGTIARPEHKTGDESTLLQTVTLREVTAETVRTICKLSDTLSEAQKHMVAPNAVSIAEAHFSEHAWFRAIYADETPVGFVMLYVGPDDEEPSREVHYLWRYMIAGPQQGKGYGRRALQMVIDDLKAKGVKEFLTSCGEGVASPEGFYRSLGFERDGNVYGDEVGLKLDLSSYSKG